MTPSVVNDTSMPPAVPVTGVTVPATGSTRTVCWPSRLGARIAPVEDTPSPHAPLNDTDDTDVAEGCTNVATSTDTVRENVPLRAVTVAVPIGPADVTSPVDYTVTMF